jgi:hypothetical protein
LVVPLDCHSMKVWNTPRTWGCRIPLGGTSYAWKFGIFFILLEQPTHIQFPIMQLSILHSNIWWCMMVSIAWCNQSNLIFHTIQGQGVEVFKYQSILQKENISSWHNYEDWNLTCVNPL